MSCQCPALAGHALPLHASENPSPQLASTSALCASLTSATSSPCNALHPARTSSFARLDLRGLDLNFRGAHRKADRVLDLPDHDHWPQVVLGQARDQRPELVQPGKALHRARFDVHQHRQPVLGQGWRARIHRPARCDDAAAPPAEVQTEEGALTCELLGDHACVQLTRAHTKRQRKAALVNDDPDHDSAPKRRGFCRRLPRHVPKLDSVSTVAPRREPRAGKVLQLRAALPAEAPVGVVLERAVLQAVGHRPVRQRDPPRDHEEQVSHAASGSLQTLQRTRQWLLLPPGHELDSMPRQTSRRRSSSIGVKHGGAGAQLQAQLGTVKEGDSVSQLASRHPQLRLCTPGLH
mmetsp:Transcript_21931/g.51162  ORF Transcript_21931/g.51162 Transcript_21931/m.51162 type:complete len:350 (-) Transcript_21931:22-1071(-)